MCKSECYYDPRIVAGELELPVEMIKELVAEFIREAEEVRDDFYKSLELEDFVYIHILSEKLYGMAISLRVEDALRAITIVKDERDKQAVKESLDCFYRTITSLRPRFHDYFTNRS